MPANKILLLMSDQHRPDLAGFAGNTVVRTPTLDWLAETGVVFENAYTPSPVCVPARQSILSGQIPSKCGCLRFGEDLPPNSMTYARQLARHGYDTVVAGKLHHSGPDQMQGWMLRIGHDNQLEERSVEGRVPRVVQPRSKVDPSTWWSWSKEIRRAGVGRSPHFIRDQYNVQGMLNYIEERFISPYYDEPLRDAPVLLKLGLNSPHYPYLTDEAKFKYYLNRVKPYDEEEFFDHPVFAQDWERVEIGKDVSFRDVRRATAAYYGLVEDMDSMCGTVLKALQDAGEDLDEWLIIYTSDHGEMLGQHGIWRS
jgi:choline-sulfatase